MEAVREVEETLSEVRQTFKGGRTRSIAWRKKQLSSLLELVNDNEENIFRALDQDLGKHPVESYRDEIGVVKKSINHTLSNLEKWVAPKKVGLPLPMFPTSGWLLPEPLGVVLVFASWNFPISLALDPMIGAIAAGNAVVLKPSEQAPASSSFLANTIPQYMDSKAVKIAEGGAEISELLLQQKWDKIFFTGSQQVGRIVMSAAAKNLTPVALELGGKSCIGVDYMLVGKSLLPLWYIESLKKTIKRFYSESPKDSKCLARVVNKRHFERLRNLFQDPPPTILLDPPLDAAIMTEEIFGPLLPIITVKKIEESIEFINSRPKPLAIYAFTKDANFRRRVLSETSSGTVVFNDILIQFVCEALPFGGVGQSGFGRYHGKYSFDTFSHEKAVVQANFFIEFGSRYPPWNDFKNNIIRSAYNLNYLNVVLLLLGLKR
ncbi:aldehyde dehydrogenase family 3 member F1-like [Pyrus communis]|uniref:aldehyde dehydrogenase family 3 member F1-like n=1 Tax=Pyrus communis TaxID=23211 RepID=UPI0035C2390D